MDKIKVIIKRPDEKAGHVTWISNTLANLQRTVDGPIEVVKIGNSGLLMICNEEGKIRGLEHNFIAGTVPFPDIIVGTVILCGQDGEEFGDVPIDMKIWKLMLKKWGNEL
ncbi:MAG TPA: hypothetical protein DCG37_06980 [Lachnospiraceae bacterium]|nr:hypothetical protein [Lachnospiraceae bacterium]